MSRFEYYGTAPSMPFEDLPAHVQEMAYYDLAQLQGREFHAVHAEESHGGNAGVHIVDGVRWQAAGINGYAALESGRMAAFGNFQFLDKDIVQDPRLQEITVQLGARQFFNDSGFNYERRILNLIVPAKAEFAPEAKDAMLGAVMLYNERQYLHTHARPE